MDALLDFGLVTAALSLFGYLSLRFGVDSRDDYPNV
jgi:hypothetical protein